MKRKFIRSCSVFLSAIILMGVGSTGAYGLLPVSVPAYAAEALTADNAIANAEASAGTVSFSEQTDLGNLLLGDVNLQENEQEVKDYEVSSVTIEDYYAEVVYHAISDCSLILGFYNDEGTKLLCAADIPVSAEEHKTTIDLLDTDVVEELPEHFLLKASLADTETQTQLSSIYEYTLYTEAMQELAEMSVFDFDEEQVLNLDDDIFNNFAVYKDSTIIVKAADNKNTVVSSDSENRVYVISAPDETVLSLKKGDIFVYDHGDDIIIAKVLKKVTKGNTVTITGDSDFSAEDVFDYIKIDQSAGLEEAEVEVPEEEGVTFEGIYDKEGNNISVKSTSTSAGTSEPDTGNGVGEGHGGGGATSWDDYYKEYTSDEFSFKLYLEKNKQNQSEPKKAYIDVGVEGTLQFYLKYYLSPAERYIQTGIKLNVGLYGEIGASFEWKVPLSMFHIKIPKLAKASISPYLDFKAEGSFEGSAMISCDAGIHVDENGVKIFCDPSFNLDGKVTASVFIGILLAPEVKILDNGIEVEWENRIGGEIAGELDLTDSHPEDSSDEWHACKKCIDGDISVVAESSVSVKFTESKKFDATLPLKFKIKDWYYSLDNKRFGFGECPFKKCKCNVSVVDMDNKPVPNAMISVHYINGAEGTSDESFRADADGKAIIALKEEYVRLSAAKGHDGGSRIVRVSGPDSFVITLNCDDEEPEEYEDPYKPQKPNGNDPDNDPGNNSSQAQGWGALDWSIFNTGKDEYYVHIYGVFYCSPSAIIIPSYFPYEGKNVYPTSIDIEPGAFRGITSLKRVDIPGNAKIGGWAFEDCTNLTKINISEGVKEIGYEAFAGCTSLESITIPKSVQSVGCRAFADCTKLTKIKIENGAYFNGSYIAVSSGVEFYDAGYRIFDGCTSLRSVYIPASLEHLRQTFKGCTKLTNVSLAYGIEGIGGFEGCTSLKKINVPGSVTDMRDAFPDCTNLETVNIPYGVTLICSAFMNCTSLKSIHVPDTVGNMEYAFFGCKNLETVNIPYGVIDISGAFMNCTSLKSIHVPDTVMDMSFAFSGCTNLTDANVSKSTISIYGAFNGCTGIKSIMIPPCVVDFCSEVPDDPDSWFYWYDYLYGYWSDYWYDYWYDYWLKTGGKAFAGCPDLIIFGVPGSCAQRYADVCGLQFYESDEMEELLNAREFSNITSHIYESLVSTISDISFYCAAAGGSGDYQFSVMYRKSNGGKWSVVQPYSENTYVSFRITNPGNYIIRINARDNSGNISVSEYSMRVIKFPKITNSNRYIYFDNSKTKWEKVCAYWWEDGYFPTIDTNGDLYGYIYWDRDGYEITSPVDWPGTEMTQLPGTDIWVAKLPYYATNIEFNSGKSDDDILAGAIGYQTDVIDFDAQEKCGKMYVIDTSVEPVPGRGLYKKKYRYHEGSWVPYDGTSLIPLKNLSSISNENIMEGNFVVINGLASGGNPDYKYRVVYKHIDDEKWTVAQDYNTNRLVIITPKKTGTYDVIVRVKGRGGKVVSKEFRFNVIPKYKNTSSLESKSVYFGEKAKIKCSAKDGAGDDKYAVLYKKSTDTEWTQARDYSSAQTAEFVLPSLGFYDIIVKAKDGMGRMVKKEFSVKVIPQLGISASVSSTKIKYGESLKVKINGSGGAGGYSYSVKYKTEEEESWTIVQDYDQNNVITFKPEKIGKLSIRAIVQDWNGRKTAKTFTVTVGEALRNLSVISPDTVFLGGSVTVTAKADGGAGSYKYAVSYKKSSSDKWSAVQGYANNNLISVKPGYIGSYDILVKVKDSAGAVQQKIFTVKVNAPLRNASKLSAESISLGESVTVNAKASGGAGNYRYAVSYKKSTSEKWSSVQGYSSTDQVAVTPKSKADYNIRVIVKDSAGTVSEKIFNLTVR